MSEGKCPIDPKTREIWMQKAQAVRKARDEREKSAQVNTELHASTGFSWRSLLWSTTPKSVPKAEPTHSEPITNSLPQPSEAVCPVSPQARSVWLSLGQGRPSNTITSSTEAVEESCSSDSVAKLDTTEDTSLPDLSDSREVSSIPRTGENANWVYPSQKQFFKAMKRKQWEPEADDMKTVVPLHNMVNEVAWRYICQWEKGEGGDKCGGIQLTSFKGDASKVTPRALIRHYIFQQDLPFDRHDWAIDRCGTKVEYVIDFYSKAPEGASEPTFYLDVRPKLNTLEGCRMRVMNAFKR